MAGHDQTILTTRTVLHRLALAQMEAVLAGGAGAARGCADYPLRERSGLGIRVQRLRRGERPGPHGS